MQITARITFIHFKTYFAGVNGVLHIFGDGFNCEGMIGFFKEMKFIFCSSG